MRVLKVINNNGVLIGDRIEVADTFYSRLKGLLGRTGLEEGQGLLLVPCNSIHCIGMRFAIDAVFMDIDRKVIWIRENMEPGAKETKKDAYYVLELASGVVKEKGIQRGDILRW